MKWNEAFPSKYFNAGDVPTKGMVVTILAIEMIDVNDDGAANSMKPVATLDGHLKQLIINHANKNFLEDTFGEEMDAILGKSVMLMRCRVQFGRKMVDGIRMLPAAVAS